MSGFKTEYIVTLDIKRCMSPFVQVPRFIQGDSIVLLASILKYGQPFDYSGAEKYTMNFRLPNGEFVHGEGTYDTMTGLITYELNDPEMAKVGLVEGSISLHQGTTKVSTFPYYFRVLEDYDANTGV